MKCVARIDINANYTPQNYLPRVRFFSVVGYFEFSIVTSLFARKTAPYNLFGVCRGFVQKSIDTRAYQE